MLLKLRMILCFNIHDNGVIPILQRPYVLVSNQVIILTGGLTFKSVSDR
jgi:hypothetical protein